MTKKKQQKFKHPEKQQKQKTENRKQKTENRKQKTKVTTRYNHFALCQGQGVFLCSSVKVFFPYFILTHALFQITISISCHHHRRFRHPCLHCQWNPAQDRRNFGNHRKMGIIDITVITVIYSFKCGLHLLLLLLLLEVKMYLKIEN